MIALPPPAKKVKKEVVLESDQNTQPEGQIWIYLMFNPKRNQGWRKCSNLEHSSTDLLSCA